MMNKIRMTKDVAFDYLKGAKIKMEINPIAIQTLVQKAGFRWSFKNPRIEFHDCYGITLHLDGGIGYCEHSDAHHWDGYFFNEMSAQEVLNIEII